MIAWSKPTGVAADKSASHGARLLSYYKNHTTLLANGVRPKPTVETMKMILNCFDLFGAGLIVESDSFTV